MKCLRYALTDNKIILTPDECTAEETLACNQFTNQYKVIHVEETSGIYGGGEEVTLDHFQKDFTGEQLTCILSQGKVIGCCVCGKQFYLDGNRSHRTTTGRGAQGPLIWDHDIWELVEK